MSLAPEVTFSDHCGPYTLKGIHLAATITGSPGCLVNIKVAAADPVSGAAKVKGC